MRGYSAGIYNEPTLSELKQRLERAREEEDHIIEINRDTLASDGHVAGRQLEQPRDVAEWLTSCGFSQDVAEFYAEAVRLGHNLVVFEAERDDDHFMQVTREMTAAEPSELQQALERWRDGDHHALERESQAEPLGGAGGHIVEGTSPERPSAEQPLAERETLGAEGMPMGAERMGESTERMDVEAAEGTIPVVEEELQVGKREIETGGVRITSTIEEQPVQEDVTLREERIEVERRPVDRPLEAGEGAFEERDIQLTERAEEPVIAKQARVVEEVELRKDVEERTETIEDVLRRTRIDIDRLGDVGDEEHGFRSHFDATFGGRGESWDEYSQAYRYGHAYGGHEELRGLDYEGMEPTMRERYDERRGQGRFDRDQDAIRYGWDRGRNPRG